MALVNLEFFSISLKRTVTVNVIIPSDKVIDSKRVLFEKPFKTLYLLHGYLGSNNDWLNNTRIKKWATDKNLVVVMPSGENKFYLDNFTTSEFFSKFIGEELVEFTRNLFPLSDKREDTFLAGLSMGGYGAIINGFKYYNTFGYIGALSSALVLDDKFILKYKCEVADYDYDKVIRCCKDYPNLYMAIGTEDFLLENNRKFVRFLDSQKIKYTYIEDKGKHDWDFWDKYIFEFLNHLPLDEKNEGLSSGNVR